MSLTVFQERLLSLYLDEGAREDFFSNRQKEVEKWNVSDKERHSLYSLPEHQVREFSQEILNKKKEYVHKGSNFPLNKAPVFLFRSFRSGPALYFKMDGGYREVTISLREYLFAAECAKKNQPLSIFQLAITACNSESLNELSFMVRVMRAYKLQGRVIKAVISGYEE